MADIGNVLAMIAAVCGPVCVGLVFAAAGAQKLFHHAILRGVIANYRLLPESLVQPAAWLLPPVEIMLGMALLCGVSQPLASAAAILLLWVFAAAMAINIARGRSHIDCGCNQAFLRQPLRPVLLARNGVLALGLLPSLVTTRPVPVSALLVGAGAGAVFFVLYNIVNVLAALPRRGGPGLVGA